jgi:hypothetical protein
MKLIKWLRNRKNYEKPKKLNLSNILNYASAEVRHWKSTSSFLSNPVHIDEQSIWRLEQINLKSPKCAENGSCIKCGCFLTEKSFESNGCEEGCYPPLMNSEEWEKFKKINNIKIIN